MSPSSAALGTALMVLAATCFATLGPLTRFAEDAGVPPLALVAWRAGLGAAVMTGFVLVRRVAGVAAAAPRPTRRERWFLAAGSLASAVLNLAVFVAFTRISIALALLLFYLYPALVAVASSLWFGERLDAVRWLALAVSLAGLVLVLAGSGVGRVDALGIVLALIGAAAQTFYVLAARHGFGNVPAPPAAGLTMAGACALYVLLSLATGSAGDLGAPLDSIDAWWPVLVAGVLGAGVPTVAYIAGIRRLGPPRAAILATLEPVIGVALAAWLLGERPAPIQLAGGLLIVLAGVLLQVRQRSTARGAATGA